MLTLPTTAGLDNEAIWIVKITTDNNVYRFATEDITLSANLYDGAVIIKNSITEVNKTIDIALGGSLGQVGNFSFKITRYSSNSLIDAFFNEFYPKTSGGEYLSSRLTEFGLTWRGKTSESEILWIDQHVNYRYAYDPGAIIIDCIELAEIEAIELPYYNIQKELNNGVSYFPTTPPENLDKTIPVLYGDFSFRE